jgi:tetratricopeptide (TPR) repeat protein
MKPSYWILILFSIYKTAYPQDSIIQVAIKDYTTSVQFESKHIDSSLFYIKKAYASLKPLDTVNQQFSDILNQYGRIFYQKQEFEKAYQYFQRCYDISLLNGSPENAYKVKVNMAVCQRQMDNPTQALTDFFEVISYYETEDPGNINLGKTYYNVADVYFLNGQHSKAEEYYKKTTPFFESNLTYRLQLLSNRIGNFNNFDLEQSISLIDTLEGTIDMDSIPVFVSAPLYNNMGQTMIRSKKYEKALSYNLKSLSIKKNAGLEMGIAKQYNNIADVYLRTENYPLAIQYLDTALLKSTTYREKFQILKNLQQAHQETKSFEKSLEYANLYIQLKDSLNEVLTQKEIAELGLQYDTNQKDQFIYKLQNLSSTYKASLAILLILSMSLIWLFFSKNKRIKAEVESLQQELDAFRSENDQAESQSERIQLNTNVILKSNEIRYVKSDGHYVEYYVNHKLKPEIERNTLSRAYKNLPNNQFARIHKSYIVNLNVIKIINSNKLMLDDGTWLNLSRTYKPDLKARLYDK